jgi:acyl phosphate:glycerol-3-phosphate acyltransferase
LLPLLGLLVAYLGGSTPTAYLAGRMIKGIDLRKHGSGNLGATNVYRTLGGPAALVVLIIDAAKGAVPALFFAGWFAASPTSWWPILYGLAAIAGHVVPYFGLFAGGGKGVATTSGVFWALAPLPSLVALIVFVSVVAVTRFVSLGSIIAALSLAMSSAVLGGIASRVTWVATLAALFVIWNHRSNIDRLLQGREARLTKPGAAA